MKIRYAIILCIITLNASVSLRHASGLEGADNALALEIVFRTDSDWSLLNFTGLGRALVGEHEVLAGGEASENYVTFHDDHFTIFTGKKAYDTTPVEIRVRLVALDPEESLLVRVGKGHIGETGVTVRAWAGGGFTEIAAFNHEGVNPLDPVTNQREYRLDGVLTDYLFDVEVPELTPAPRSWSSRSTTPGMVPVTVPQEAGYTGGSLRERASRSPPTTPSWGPTTPWTPSS